MKCISLLSVELEHMFDNLQNWLCPPCIEDWFHFNLIEDDDDFAYICHNVISNIIKTTDLIYNPFDSNASNFINCSEFDPDLNFFCKQNLFSGHCCSYFLGETLNEKKSNVLVAEILNFSLFVTLISIAWKRTSKTLLTILIHCILIFKSLVLQRHGLMISHVNFMIWKLWNLKTTSTQQNWRWCSHL